MDELGLDRLVRPVLSALCERFNGGPVGLSTLAMAVGEERETVEEVAEPFLVRQGFLMRTPRGRVATARGWAHLGLTMPNSAEPNLFGGKRGVRPASESGFGTASARVGGRWSCRRYAS